MKLLARKSFPVTTNTASLATVKRFTKAKLRGPIIENHGNQISWKSFHIKLTETKKVTVLYSPPLSLSQWGVCTVQYLHSLSEDCKKKMHRYFSHETMHNGAVSSSNNRNPNTMLKNR